MCSPSPFQNLKSRCFERHKIVLQTPVYLSITHRYRWTNSSRGLSGTAKRTSLIGRRSAKEGGGAVGKGGEGEGEGVVEGKGRVVGGRPRGCVKGAGG